MYATGARDAKSNAAGSPVYQIDFTAVDSGKRIASTKRRIRWRFGFSNADALAAGETGTACRGEEHDITLIWSITSGKRLVLADGQEVHYSNNRSHLFDFSWTMRGNHVLKVIAHANPPSNATQSFRQYDFFVDGMSFFNMPKVYRLGLVGSVPTQEPAGNLALATTTRAGYNNYTTSQEDKPGVGNDKKSAIAEIEAPHNRDEEQAYLAEAIRNSLNDKHGHSDNRSLPPPRQNDLLVDMMSEPGIPTTSMTTTEPRFAEGAKPVANVSFRQKTEVPRFDQPTNPNPPFTQSTFQQNSTSYSSTIEPPAVPSPFAVTNQTPAASHPFEAAPVPASQTTASAPSPQTEAQSQHAAAGPAPPSYTSAYGSNPFFAAAPSSYAPNQAPPPYTSVTSESPYSSFTPSADTPAPALYAAAAPAPPPQTAAPTSAPTTFDSAPADPTVVEPEETTPPEAVEPPAPPVESPTLTMNPKPAGLGSDANVAFERFANMDQFDLIPKASGGSDAKNRDNPFDDVVSKAPAPTLAGMKMMGGHTEKKEVMKSNPDVMPGALVLSGNQNSQWGGYTGLGSQAPGLSNSTAYNGLGSQAPGLSNNMAYNGLGSQAPGLNYSMTSQGYGQMGNGAASNMAYGQMANGSVTGSTPGMSQPQQYYGMSNNLNAGMNYQSQNQYSQQAQPQLNQQYGYQQGSVQQQQQTSQNQGYGYAAQQPL